MLHQSPINNSSSLNHTESKSNFLLTNLHPPLIPNVLLTFPGSLSCIFQPCPPIASLTLMFLSLKEPLRDNCSSRVSANWHHCFLRVIQSSRAGFNRTAGCIHCQRVQLNDCPLIADQAAYFGIFLKAMKLENLTEALLRCVFKYSWSYFLFFLW